MTNLNYHSFLERSTSKCMSFLSFLILHLSSGPSLLPLFQPPPLLLSFLAVSQVLAWHTREGLRSNRRDKGKLCIALCSLPPNLLFDTQERRMQSKEERQGRRPSLSLLHSLVFLFVKLLFDTQGKEAEQGEATRTEASLSLCFKTCILKEINCHLFE